MLLSTYGPRLKDCRGDEEVGIHVFAFSSVFMFSSFPGGYKGGGALFIVNSLSPSHLKSEGKKKIKRENKISSMVAHSVISF